MLESVPGTNHPAGTDLASLSRKQRQPLSQIKATMTAPISDQGNNDRPCL